MKIAFLIFSYLHKEKPNMPILLHTLLFAKEMKDKGDEVKIIFEGEGVQWAKDFLNEDHPLHNHAKPLFENIVVCEACASMFNVLNDIKDKVTVENALYGHISLRKYLEENYKIIEL